MNSADRSRKRECAARRAGAGNAIAPKTPREAWRITSNADIGTSEWVPGLGARKAHELFTTLLNR